MWINTDGIQVFGYYIFMILLIKIIVMSYNVVSMHKWGFFLPKPVDNFTTALFWSQPCVQLKPTAVRRGA